MTFQLVTLRVEEIDISAGELSDEDLVNSYLSSSEDRTPLDIVTVGGRLFVIFINSLTRRDDHHHQVTGIGYDAQGETFTFVGEIDSHWHTGSLTATYLS